jgi:hypothetical protein
MTNRKMKKCFFFTNQNPQFIAIFFIQIKILKTFFVFARLHFIVRMQALESKSDERRMISYVQGKELTESIKAWFVNFREKSAHIRCFDSNCVFGTLLCLSDNDIAKLYHELDGKFPEIPRKFITCKKCKCARYCSRKCLVRNWIFHKAHCIVISDSRDSLESLKKSFALAVSIRNKEYMFKALDKLRQAEKGNFCKMELNIAEHLTFMAVDKDYGYLWKDSVTAYHGILSMEQLDLNGIVDIFPAVLIGAKLIRKAYMFCLWWAYADKYFNQRNWPFEEPLDGDWIWGPLCCNVRLFQDPFRMEKMDHDEFDLLYPADFRTQSLIALLLIKILIMKELFSDIRNKAQSPSEQLSVIKKIADELKRRDENLLKALLEPDKALSEYEDLEENSKISKLTYMTVKIYSHLIWRYRIYKDVEALFAFTSKEYKLEDIKESGRDSVRKAV